MTLGETRPALREAIVVEGKDDVAAVKLACDAQVIVTSGLGISREIIEQIRIAKDRCGVIVLTDPDAPGERIRRIIEENVPGCKHAYIYQDGKPGKTGVEYASVAEIREALKKVHATQAVVREDPFSISELMSLGLAGADNADKKREQAAKLLSLGKCNGKQFLRRLNAYGISREALIDACKEIQRS